MPTGLQTDSGDAKRCQGNRSCPQIPHARPHPLDVAPCLGSDVRRPGHERNWLAEREPCTRELVCPRRIPVCFESGTTLARSVWRFASKHEAQRLHVFRDSRKWTGISSTNDTDHVSLLAQVSRATALEERLSGAMHINQVCSLDAMKRAAAGTLSSY